MNNKTSPKPDLVIPELARGFLLKKETVFLDYKKAILYSLGIGLGSKPLNDSHLKYTFEHAEGFTAFPTITTILSDASDLFEKLIECPGLPQFDPMSLLHGEQEICLPEPITPETEFQIETRLLDIEDKGKGALAIIESKGFKIDNTKLKSSVSFINTMRLFIRGIGGFSKISNASKPIIKNLENPSKSALTTLVYKTDENQALLYRLNGDFNPLHADPSMAMIGGFKKPILHGLCTFGITAQKIVLEGLKKDNEDLKNVKARFTGHVYPGETLEIEVRKITEDSFSFQGKVKERNSTVIKGLIGFRASPKPRI